MSTPQLPANELTKEQKVANRYARIELHDKIIEEAQVNINFCTQLRAGTEKSLRLKASRRFLQIVKDRRNDLVWDLMRIDSRIPFQDGPGFTALVEGPANLSPTSLEKVGRGKNRQSLLQTKLSESGLRLRHLLEEHKVLEEESQEPPPNPQSLMGGEAEFIDSFMEDLESDSTV